MSTPISEETPLVKKRDTKTTLGKLLTQIYQALTEFLAKTEQVSSKRTFFGVGNQDLTADKRMVVEQTITLVKQLKKAYSTTPFRNALKELGDILLDAKFQSLALYIKNGERPIALDQCLDHCIHLFSTQVLKVNDQEIQQLFKSLLVVHQAIAMKQLFDQYHEKILSMCVKNSHNEPTFEALNRFHEQLNGCNKTFLEGLDHFTLNLFDRSKHPSVTPELYAQIRIFLNDQKSKIMEDLEPPSEDLKFPDVSKIYMWGITAVSKVAAYMRGLNDQLISNAEPKVKLHK